MKLAEELANRADLQKRLEQMRGRLAQSALVQENESPLRTRRISWRRWIGCWRNWRVTSRGSTAPT